MTNLFDLTGKKAVVIGGAGGIGQAIAQGFAESGAEVLISSRNEENLKRAVEEINNDKVSYYVADASDEESVKALFDVAVEKFGKVDILCNSQGINLKHVLPEMTVEDWDKMFQVNVKGIMLSCKYFGAHMKENGYGKIINISSVRGIRACPNGNTGYGATKGAVDMFTRMASVDLGPEVCVNAIGPTVTLTPMMDKIMPKDPAFRASLGANMPLKRIGEVEDCVGPAIFLAAPASDFVTGQIIYPDGGLTAVG